MDPVCLTFVHAAVCTVFLRHGWRHVAREGGGRRDGAEGEGGKVGAQGRLHRAGREPERCRAAAWGVDALFVVEQHPGHFVRPRRVDGGAQRRSVTRDRLERLETERVGLVGLARVGVGQLGLQPEKPGRAGARRRPGERNGRSQPVGGPWGPCPPRLAIAPRTETRCCSRAPAARASRECPARSRSRPPCRTRSPACTRSSTRRRCGPPIGRPGRGASTRLVSDASVREADGRRKAHRLCPLPPCRLDEKTCRRWPFLVRADVWPASEPAATTPERAGRPGREQSGDDTEGPARQRAWRYRGRRSRGTVGRLGTRSQSSGPSSRRAPFPWAPRP